MSDFNVEDQSLRPVTELQFLLTIFKEKILKNTEC